MTCTTGRQRIEEEVVVHPEFFAEYDHPAAKG
jgi:hypothetical protein